jgi:TPR repeat protein
MTRTLAIFLFSAAVLLPAAAYAESTAAGTYEEGLVLYEDSRYSDAISALSIAAEEGDVRAQQLLGMMYLYGEQLYGSAVPRDLGLARSWLYRAEAQGSQVARFALTRLDSGQPVPATLALVPTEESGE